MGTAWALHGHGMGTAWARHGHGMGTAWARHALCESVFILLGGSVAVHCVYKHICIHLHNYEYILNVIVIRYIVIFT